MLLIDKILHLVDDIQTRILSVPICREKKILFFLCYLLPLFSRSAGHSRVERSAILEPAGRASREKCCSCRHAHQECSAQHNVLDCLLVQNDKVTRLQFTTAAKMEITLH